MEMDHIVHLYYRQHRKITTQQCKETSFAFKDPFCCYALV